MPGAPFPDRQEQYNFAVRLDSLQQDPQGAFLALQEGLELDDLDARLWLPPTIVRSSVAELSVGAIKTIGTASKLVAFFSRYGVLSASQQGDWLSQNGSLWFGDQREPPLAILRRGSQANGPHRDNILRVLNAANDFLLPARLTPEVAQKEAWAVIRSGAGELIIAHSLDIGYPPSV